MPADICLLLMQSLSGECGPVGTVAADPAVPLTAAGDRAIAPTTPIAPATAAAIAPDPAEEPPQFASCGAAAAETPCNLAAPVPAPSPAEAPPGETMAAASVTPPPAVPTDAGRPLTHPVTLDLPHASRAVALPPVPTPQFSPPGAIAAVPRPVSTPAARRPTSGAQLYRQRQLALQAGRTYTRLAPDAHAEQWQRATYQPTYQEWQQLLAREAIAVGGGQGQNRLEVILGDSLGLWLPSEMLPRDRLWLNQSISGDTTAGILQRVPLLAQTRPSTIHLLAGANDLKNGVPEAQIVGNLRRTVQQLQRQHPQARIVIYSVLPTRRADIGNGRVRSLNAHLAQFAQHPAVEFRNVYDWFQDDGGHLRPDLTTDGLHLNAQGYALWQRAILARVW